MRTKRNLSAIVILSAIIYLLTGCAKKCDEFNTDIINWMPYKKTDKIILSFNNIKDTLTVNNTQINHTEKVGQWTKCACEDTYSTELSSESIKIKIYFYSSKSVENSFVIINNDNLSFLDQLNSYQLNGNTYSNVIVYKNNSQNLTKRFDQLIISESVGIIEIIEINKDWVPEDNSIRNIKVSMIDFNKTDC